MEDGLSYAEQVGAQVTRLIETHSILMASDADMAARKVRHALQNYIAQVDQVLGEQDGGRAPRSFRVEPPAQIELEDDIAKEEQDRLERENQEEAVNG